MAEPDDIEEDLFADLYDLSHNQRFIPSISDLLFSRYDADDNINKQTPAVEAPKAPDSTVSATPAQPLVTQSIENTHLETEDSQNAYQPPQYEEGYQNGAGGVDTGFGNNAAPSAAETERQGTGIKEDG